MLSRLPLACEVRIDPVCGLHRGYENPLGTATFIAIDKRTAAADP